MQIPILVEPVANNGYRATSGPPLALSVEGTTRAEAIGKLELLLRHRLRNGEVGLSLFRSADQTGPETIVAAVRAAGKQGELGVVEIPVSVFHGLRLRLVQTPGGTPDAAVNALHIEARPSWWRRLVLRFRGVPIHEWFNAYITPELAAAAKLVE